MQIVTRKVVSKVVGNEVNTLLFYDPTEPFSVRIFFSEDNVWEVSREVLMECLRNRTAGLLNVTLDSDGENVTMHLTSETGSVMVTINHGELASFIHDTYEQVPENHEDRFLDLDAKIQDFWSSVD